MSGRNTRGRNKRGKRPDPRTLAEAVRRFGGPEQALRFLVQLRWPRGVCCPTCGSSDVHFLTSRSLWECNGNHGKRQFSVRIGTGLEDGKLPLNKWLIAIWLEANSRNGISSYKLARQLGVTQKTAWFLQQRIRIAERARSSSKVIASVKVEQRAVRGSEAFL